ncbi:hypothetical protein XENORESO_010846, partial [Xenotaenia resolanae]
GWLTKVKPVGILLLVVLEDVDPEEIFWTSATGALQYPHLPSRGCFSMLNFLA